MTLGAAAQAAAALTAVVALVLLAGLAARRGWSGTRLADAPGALRLRATLALDTRRRVHLLEAPGGTVIVLTGGASDALLALPPEPRA